MRIGIITYWACNYNYGQLLQCYALQAFLRARGHEPFLIKYQFVNTFGSKVIGAFKKPSLLIRSIKYRISQMRTREQEFWSTRDFDSFRNKHIVSTKKIYQSLAQLDTPDVDADVYVCGSDQIWSELFVQRTDNAKPFFLGFGRNDAKRVAYAASFGMPTVSDNFIQFIRPLLKQFDGISTREASGVKICALAGRNDAEHVLDPTLLLRKSDYLKAFAGEMSQDIKKNRYAFLYFLKTEMNTPWDEIKAFCDNNNLKMKVTAVYGSQTLPFDEFHDPSIPEWINTINNADVVFANSFHSIVFSIIMQRPFLVFLRKDYTKGMNDRITSLLISVGLESRIFDENKESIASQMSVPIDWNSVERSLDVLRDRSTAYINKCSL